MSVKSYNNMKNIITILVFISFLACSSVLVSQEFELIESYSLTDIQNEIADLGIPEAFFSPDNGVDFYSVTYETTHPNGDIITVSGAVCIPQTINCELPMATYQHGTVFLPEDVPSNLNGESIIGVLFASKGYIVPMPDYIGLGVSSEYVHLYVHAESEAQAGLDLLRAVRDAQESLDFGWNEQVFICGYSQGGHAAAALQRKIETEFSEEFSVTASVPMSGPYDLSGAQTDFVLDGDFYPTPGYLPYLMIGYQDVYGGIYENLEEILLPEYAAIVQDYIDGEISLIAAQDQLPDIPTEMLQADFLEDFTNNPDNALFQAIADNDLLDWAPQAPTRVIYCNADDQVSPQNSLNALDIWQENGAVELDGVDGGNLDHGGCVLPALLGGLFFFEGFVETPLDFDISFTITDDAAGAGVGEINVDFSSDETYTLIWDDQTEGNVLSGLTAGTYTLTVMSSGGCAQEFEIEVDDSVQINEITTADFKVYPNPTSNELFLDLNNRNNHVVLMDARGKEVLIQNSEMSNQMTLDLSNLSNGMYFLTVNNLSPVRIIKE